MDREKVVVAELLRPRGNRGEILARSTSDVPGRFAGLKCANASLRSGADVPVEIAEAWTHNGGWVLKFAGVDSIDAAERFRGADLWVPVAERAALPEGEFFRSDLIGCRVLNRANGKCIGVLEDWQDCGGPLLMELAAEGRELLIPFVPEHTKVDLDARTVLVDVPEGLLDL